MKYKCPNCGGSIKFDAQSGTFRCESCENTYDEADLQKYDDIINNTESTTTGSWSHAGSGAELDGMNSYICKSCGAQIVADENTAASSCPYCDSPIIMSGALSGALRPDYVLPFKLDKKAAINALNNFYRGKKLLPDSFTDQNKIKEIKSIYVPFWLFNSDVSADITFNATRTRHWSDSRYNYTEINHYVVSRGGSISFSNIPVDASTTMEDSYMDGIEPFDYATMTDFNPAYLSGFLADKYDVSAEDSFERANSRVRQSTSDIFRSTVMGYDSVSLRSAHIDNGSGSYSYALLPVWIFNTKYKGTNYLFTINGQTGSVAGVLPVDRGKFWKYFMLYAGIVAALGQLVVLL